MIQQLGSSYTLVEPPGPKAIYLDSLVLRGIWLLQEQDAVQEAESAQTAHEHGSQQGQGTLTETTLWFAMLVCPFCIPTPIPTTTKPPDSPVMRQFVALLQVGVVKLAQGSPVLAGLLLFRQLPESSQQALFVRRRVGTASLPQGREESVASSAKVGRQERVQPLSEGGGKSSFSTG